MRVHALLRVPAITALTVALAVQTGCSSDPAPDRESEAMADAQPDAQPVPSAQGAASVVRLLADGAAVFGVFSGDKTPEQGAAMASNREADFILYSLESGPFDVETLSIYVDAHSRASAQAGVAPRPVLLRTPPIHIDPDGIQEQVRLGLEAGAAGIVFPHVVDASEAARSVELLDGAAPGALNASTLDVLIVEDHEGMLNAREIMATEHLSVVFAGPGDLRRAYDGDMEQVEAAIQAILAACLEFDVPCGVTAGATDIGDRLDQGFRVLIVTEPEALAVGRAHAGRGGEG